MLHQNTLQAARITELEEQLAAITKRKSRKRKWIQQGSTMEYSEAASQVAVEASIAAQPAKKARSSGNQERAQQALRRCRNCGKTGHNACMCKKDTKIYSQSDVSTMYIGSLFNRNEIEDL